LPYEPSCQLASEKTLGAGKYNFSARPLAAVQVVKRFHGSLHGARMAGLLSWSGVSANEAVPPVLGSLLLPTNLAHPVFLRVFPLQIARDVVISELPAQMRDTFELVGLTHLFKFYGSDVDAVGSF
jgi:hypothetical protein